jgi:ferrous iron transport protein B
MYLLGVVTAVAATLVLNRTLLRGAAQPFVMELPSYKLPSAAVVLHRMLERGWCFVRQAGALIFAMTILVWAAAYYPRDPRSVPPGVLQRRAELAREIERIEGEVAEGEASGEASLAQTQSLRDELARCDVQIANAYLQASYLGRAGRLIEPVVKPLGWDWRIGCAVIASFPAREVVIATLGVIYNLGEHASQKGAKRGETPGKAGWGGVSPPTLPAPVALSLMVFFALCAQFVSTLAVIRRETNSWRWPIFTFAYMTTLAYLGAMAAYQLAMFVTKTIWR